MKLKWIIASLSFILIFAVIIYQFIYARKRDVMLENVAYKMKANELIDLFEKNESLANSKFKYKVIEVNGKIGETSKNQDKGLIVILKENDEFFGINCSFTNFNFKLDQFNAGDSICIRGIVQGYLDDVILTNCKIIKN